MVIARHPIWLAKNSMNHGAPVGPIVTGGLAIASGDRQFDDRLRPRGTGNADG